jgi:RimJ/RimL family protein N-acetyltransferase
VTPPPAHIAPETFRTVRLLAERVAPQHTDAMIALHADAEAMQRIHGTGTADETRAWMDEKMTHWQSHGFGLWVLSLAGGGAGGGAGAGAAGRQVVGRAGLQLSDGEDEPAGVQLLYLLGSPWWGRGLATEAARAVLVIAFDHLRLPEVLATVKRTNVPSQRVLDKLGFARGEEFEHDGEPWLVYRLKSPPAAFCPLRSACRTWARRSPWASRSAPCATGRPSARRAPGRRRS